MKSSLYAPSSFSVEDSVLLLEFVKEHPFATLITVEDDFPTVSYAPLLLDASGTFLVGHLAKANPHWKLFDGRPSLAIFHGPHAYVSPRWYESTPQVPTWNYAVVHVTGSPELLPEGMETESELKRLVLAFDSELPKIRPEGLAEEYVARHAKGVVAFRMAILKMEGKFKLSQNKSSADREGAISALEAMDPASQAVAALMRKLGRL